MSQVLYLRNYQFRPRSWFLPNQQPKIKIARNFVSAKSQPDDLNRTLQMAVNTDKLLSPWHLVWLTPVSYATAVYFGETTRPSDMDEVSDKRLPHYSLLGAAFIDAAYATFSRVVKRIMGAPLIPTSSDDAIRAELVPAITFSTVADYQCGIHPVPGLIDFTRMLIILRALPVSNIFCPNLGYRILATASEIYLREMLTRWGRRRYPKWFPAPVKQM